MNITEWAKLDLEHIAFMLKGGKMSYLVIIRKEDGRWVVDQDSYHIFEDEGGNYPAQEITIRQIRAIEQPGGLT